MWIQEPDNQKQRPPKPPKDIMMVNPRGRVILVDYNDAQNLGTQGYKKAPEGSTAGEYLPIYDQGEQTKVSNPVPIDKPTVNMPDLLQVAEIT